MDVDQDTLDGYIMSAYSNLAKPQGELAGAVSAINDTLSGKALDRNLGYMRQLKAVTPETVKAAAEIYRKAWENGVHSTAGSAAAINANADLYDAILNPFNTQDASQVEFTDAAEGSEYYEAVRFAFENKLMYPVSQTAFGVDEDATLGDMAIFLYALGIEDIEDGQEALDTLAEFGIMPKGASADDPLTQKAAETALSSFSQAVGVSYKKDATATENVMTRGELAQKVYDYTMPLIG